MKYLLLFIPSLVFAVDGAHHGSISDLIAPGVNFTILVAFLVWKCKKPLSDHFKNLAKTTKASMDEAEAKSKEAKLKFEANQKKLNQLESEIEKINRLNDEELQKYEVAFREELASRSKNNLADAETRLEIEKQVALNELGEDVLAKIISKTKNNIGTNSANKSNAEKVVMERLG